MNAAPAAPCLQPYLFFDGQCKEALDFYSAALGAEVVELMTFGQAPPGEGSCVPGQEDKVMHASFRVAGSLVMASDGHCSGQPEFRGFALAITLPDGAAAQQAFTALAEGGETRMPFGPTFFSPGFGMVSDRFGVCWMVLTEK